MIVFLKLKSGDIVAIYSDEIVSCDTGFETDSAPARILLHAHGEDEPAAYRTPDLFCAFLRACNGRERIDPDPLPRPFRVEPRRIVIPPLPPAGYDGGDE